MKNSMTSFIIFSFLLKMFFILTFIFALVRIIIKSIKGFKGFRFHLLKVLIFTL